MPAEREVSDTEEDIEDSFNAVKEWQLMQVGALGRLNYVRGAVTATISSVDDCGVASPDSS
jgi:hypothetical protein